ncbi:hypothetical protein SAMN05216582_13115 [Selenomonas ruminantium]|uniref:Uncharacterized protein n=1 Tax=Selenomonas ruminantium TaxID=971 RepID=A0A1M6X3L6_SELRU|nr:hypothetical protein [Selenomonas ruminantium]SHL00570.1 hypothetical protein SAMN05216582_13115 [Selenomonas ruminantium]
MSKMQEYLIEALMAAFLILFVLWAVGYVCNAVYGMHFELQSCWGGFQAIGGAGTLAAVKYIMDSWKNSPVGENPIATLKNATASMVQSEEKK